MLIFSLIALQIIIFAGLIFVMRKVLTRNVVLATKHLDDLNQDYTKKEEEASRQLEDARQKSQESLNKARQEADVAKEKILKEAGAESENLLKQARQKGEEMIQQADKARERLLSEINERIESQSVNKAIELIELVLPDKFRKDLHAEWAEDLIHGGFVRFENLTISKDVKEAKVASAFALADPERKALVKKIKEAVGHELEIKEEIDPGIIAGIVISVGSLVLDGSFRNKIREQAKSVKHAAGK